MRFPVSSCGLLDAWWFVAPLRSNRYDLGFSLVVHVPLTY